MEARKRAQMLQGALDSLPGDQAQLVRLAHFKGLTAKQIAVILEKPSEQAVRSALYRAMKQLRTDLQRQGYFDRVRV